jgi:hypothetical protein
MLKKLVSYSLLLFFAFTATACMNQVSAQKASQSDMSFPVQPPAEDPNDAQRPDPSASDPSGVNSKGKKFSKFKRPRDSKDKITKDKAIEKANSVAWAYGKGNPKVLRAQETSYEGALQLGSEPLTVPQGDSLAEQPVWAVEMEGSFKIKSREKLREKLKKDKSKSDSSDLSTEDDYKKAVVIVNAADGEVIGYRFFRD